MKTEKKEINMQIGKRLQSVRENSGYTQEAFAETLEVSVEHYRKLESGVYGLLPEKMLICTKIQDRSYLPDYGGKEPYF